MTDSPVIRTTAAENTVSSQHNLESPSSIKAIRTPTVDF